jgi:hypothetical protein
MNDNFSETISVVIARNRNGRKVNNCEQIMLCMQTVATDEKTVYSDYSVKPIDVCMQRKLLFCRVCYDTFSVTRIYSIDDRVTTE